MVEVYIVFILLIKVGVLTFMSWINSTLICVQVEKKCSDIEARFLCFNCFDCLYVCVFFCVQVCHPRGVMGWSVVCYLFVIPIRISRCTTYLGLLAIKPVFGVSDKARLKTVSSATQTS